MGNSKSPLFVPAEAAAGAARSSHSTETTAGSVEDLHLADLTETIPLEERTKAVKDNPGKRPSSLQSVSVKELDEAEEAFARPAQLTRLQTWRSWLPPLAAAAALLVHLLLPSKSIFVPEHPYFLYFLILVGAITLGLAVTDTVRRKPTSSYRHQSLFLAVAITFLNVLNAFTLKTTLLPALYFPPLDKILAVIVEDSGFLATCIGHSAKLLFTGFFFGALAGLATGISVGFSRKWAYWINPIIKALGPIPATAWIPVVLVVFPTSYSASVFMIAFAVWFPTTVMTSSGVSNVQNSYFEVSSTLGASSRYQIFRVGVPAAMPSMFIGIFNGACASFIALMTAEMLGVKYGIGWYINWQKEMLAYANVYAGLLLIAISFSVLITLLFKFRDRVLLWQKGVIKW
ncbi:ABC transporter permease [Gorillibacterium timonense]|uniref:ABC transporter permease n=1 Tax=Gorillibacterium timonense TaxID=1689269 RepID=UPI000AECFAF6|nr:ABC transporter permease subunit [Gorillibacterium timonense]